MVVRAEARSRREMVPDWNMAINVGKGKGLNVNGNEVRDVNICRMVVLGSPGVGKTALTVRFLTKRFIGEYCPTLESIYKYNTMVDDDEMRLEILDTAGQINEVHREGYAMWGDCFMFVYSITDRGSFQEIAALKKQIENAKKSTSIVGMVVANKGDLLYSRTVSYRQGQDLAEDLGCKFMEVSASDWTQVTSVSNMFLDLCREYKKTKTIQNGRQRKTSSSQKFKNAIQKVISGKSSSSKKLSVYQ